MSRILDKAFDAGKKIVRSIFLGSPNLFTSSDLNRQLEAIKYQMDQLDDKVGFISDFEITSASLKSGSTLHVEFSFSYLKGYGCSFSPEKHALEVNLPNSGDEAYLCLVADSEVVTFETDSSHTIAGAVFEDDTKYPAANQLRYKDERLVLVRSINSLNNLVGIVSLFIRNADSTLTSLKNTAPDRRNSSLLEIERLKTSLVKVSPDLKKYIDAQITELTQSFNASLDQAVEEITDRIPSTENIESIIRRYLSQHCGIISGSEQSVSVIYHWLFSAGVESKRPSGTGT